jgi:hypothetical protein
MKDLSIFENVSVNPRNAELFEFLINYARSKDVPVYSGSSKSSYIEGFHHFNFDGEHFSGNLKPNRKEVSVEEFIALCDEWAKTDVKLNSNYTAKIDRVHKIVHVGCQQFTFESISNLHRAICNKV